MGKTVTEFVYLKFKPGVRPEDPENSEEGKRFLDVVNEVKNSRGYQGASWGRTAEDENSVVWAVDWEDSTYGVRLNTSLTSLLDPSTPPITFHSRLIPPTATTINKNPTNEIIVLAFPSSYKTDEGKQGIEAELAAFRKRMLGLPDGKAPLSFSIGWFDRPEIVKHSESPTGAALLNCLVIGWKTVEDHMNARETSDFATGVQSIREKMLPPVEGLEMRHVDFQGI